MIHLVNVIKASGQQIAAAKKLLHDQDGFFELENGVWLVATKLGATEIRDLLSANAQDTKFMVLTLSGRWASYSMSEAAQWLKSATGWF